MQKCILTITFLVNLTIEIKPQNSVVLILLALCKNEIFSWLNTHISSVGIHYFMLIRSLLEKVFMCSPGQKNSSLTQYQTLLKTCLSIFDLKTISLRDVYISGIITRHTFKYLIRTLLSSLCGTILRMNLLFLAENFQHLHNFHIF